MIARRTPIIRTALKRKPRRFVVSAGVLAYWEWISEQPCAVCAMWEGFQRDKTEVAHVGLRGLAQKCNPWEVIPLCQWHHGREFPQSVHVLGKRFWEFHGLDRYALIRRFKTQYFGLTGLAASRETGSVRPGGV